MANNENKNKRSLSCATAQDDPKKPKNGAAVPVDFEPCAQGASTAVAPEPPKEATENVPAPSPAEPISGPRYRACSIVLQATQKVANVLQSLEPIQQVKEDGIILRLVKYAGFGLTIVALAGGFVYYTVLVGVPAVCAGALLAASATTFYRYCDSGSRKTNELYGPISDIKKTLDKDVEDINETIVSDVRKINDRIAQAIAAINTANQVIRSKLETSFIQLQQEKNDLRQRIQEEVASHQNALANAKEARDRLQLAYNIANEQNRDTSRENADINREKALLVERLSASRARCAQLEAALLAARQEELRVPGVSGPVPDVPGSVLDVPVIQGGVIQGQYNRCVSCKTAPHPSFIATPCQHAAFCTECAQRMCVGPLRIGLNSVDPSSGVHACGCGKQVDYVLFPVVSV